MNLIAESTQFGYKQKSSCIDVLNKVHNFLRKDGKAELLMMDLSKAFDAVNRKLLWTALYRKGVPIELIRMLREGHKKTSLAPKNKGMYGDDIETNVGVFQGASFSALGFIIYLCDMMGDLQALNDEEK